MNRFLRSSLPQLLYSTTVRSSLYPSSSVLSTPPPLRHFSNKSQEHLRNVCLSGLRDPYITMVGDWETVRLRYHDYDPYYIDPRVVYVSNNRDPDVTSYKNITVFEHTEVTSYKNITIFDVDSIVDAEIAMHIFDSAILVLSCLYGVNIDSIAIFQQMTRFQFPMFIFIDDVELEGADPWNFLDQVKSKLNHRCAAIQVPIRSIDDCYIGFVDLVKLKPYFFRSKKSSISGFFDRVANKLKGYFSLSQTPDYDDVEVEEVAKDMQAFVLKKRRELIEIVSEVDDKLSEDFHGGSQISESVLDDAIRRATIAREFVPIFMGTFSDERYEGLELLREGVIRYLPSPIDVSNYALDQNKNGEKIELSGSIDAPFVAKAFTNVHNNSNLVTYLRIYQGVIKEGDFITNVNTGEKIKIPTLCKRHDDEIDYVDEAHAGEIVMLFGVLLKSGDTLTDGSVRYTMTSADVPTDGSSIPHLLYSTVRSSASPPSSPSFVLPLHLRHFSNKSVEHLRHVWISGYNYETMHTDGNSIEESMMSGRKRHTFEVHFGRDINRHTQTYVTSYKNITLFDISCGDTFFEKISSDLVDFNVDVQLVSRIFDSAVLVLSCQDGVKTESIAIDQQMTRFQLPRLIFIDDLDQEGADLWNIVDQVKSKLNHRCAAIQVPIRSIDDCYIGFVDLVKLEAYFFSSKPFDGLFDLVSKLKGYFFCSETSDYDDIHEDMKAFVLKKRRELIEIVSEVDDKLSEALRGGNQIPESYLDDAIRRATIARKFVPIIISDERYDGLELFKEGVIRYLPSPIDVSNYALDQNRNGEKVELSGSIDAPFVAKAFANWHLTYLKLTYLRIYQGVIKKGDFITNVNTGEKILIPRLGKRHDDLIEDLDEAHAGEIVIVFDAHLKSGDTFTDGSVRYTMTSADVPTYSVSKDSGEKFSNGVN